MSKKKKTLADVQTAFASFKTVLADFGQELNKEVDITFDPEKSRVSLTKGQLILKSMSASAFVGHVEFLESLNREIDKKVHTIPAFTQPDTVADALLAEAVPS